MKRIFKKTLSLKQEIDKLKQEIEDIESKRLLMNII